MKTILIRSGDQWLRDRLVQSFSSPGFELKIEPGDCVEKVDESLVSLLIIDMDASTYSEETLVKQCRMLHQVPVLVLAGNTEHLSNLFQGNLGVEVASRDESTIACIILIANMLIRHWREHIEHKAIIEEVQTKASLFDFTNEGVVVTDPRIEDNPIVFCNEAFCRITGFQPEEIIGKNCRFLNRHDREQPQIDEIREAVADARMAHVCIRNFKNNDEPFWNELTIAPVFANDGKLIAFTSIMKDVTEKIKTKEKYYCLEKELYHAQRVSVAGEVLSAITHEINQPLTAILGETYSIVERIKTNRATAEETIKGVEKVGKIALRAGDLVARLSGLLRGRGNVSPTNCNLNEVIGDVLAILERQLKKDVPKVNLSLDKNIPFVLADTVLIQQVFINLIENSIEALKSMHKDRRRLNIETKLENDFVTCVVGDNGPGVKEEDASKIFEPFWTSKSEGTGMGLAICKRILERHNGKIYMAKNRDQGAGFVLALPVCVVGKTNPPHFKDHIFSDRNL